MVDIVIHLFALKVSVNHITKSEDYARHADYSIEANFIERVKKDTSENDR